MGLGCFRVFRVQAGGGGLRAEGGREVGVRGPRFEIASV